MSKPFDDENDRHNICEHCYSMTTGRDSLYKVVYACSFRETVYKRSFFEEKCTPKDWEKCKHNNQQTKGTEHV